MSELADNLRSRVLEVLQLVASADAQRRYQAAVPNVDVPAELFNQWEESFFPQDSNFRGAFTKEELNALERFDLEVRGVSEQTPNELPDLESFLRSPWWNILSSAAEVALHQLKRLETAD